MRPLEMTARLAGFERRGPGTDAERRAARWLASELRATGRRVSIEPFWCRPNWALAHAWHAALGLAGSLISVGDPTIGVVLLAVALASIVADGLTGMSLGRRLTPERASQNVAATQGAASREAGVASPKAAALLVTANYDAPRTALVDRDALRRPAAAVRRLAGPLSLGWLGMLAVAILWLLATAVVRASTHDTSNVLSAIQLPPSVALVLALALLLEAAGAGYGPAARDNASGVAVAIALAGALKDNPPRNMEIQLVLTGAGEGHEIGIRRYLKAHSRELGQVIVLGIAPCGDGQVRWWRSDGRLIPVGYSRRFRELADAVAHERAVAGERAVAHDQAVAHERAVAGERAVAHDQAVAHDPAREHRGRGATPAVPARARIRPLPAIAIGNLDALGLPRATPGRIDPANLSHAVEFGLLLIEAIDAELDPAATAAAHAPTPV